MGSLEHFLRILFWLISLLNIIFCHNSNVPLLHHYISTDLIVKGTQWLYPLIERSSCFGLGWVGDPTRSELTCGGSWCLVVGHDFSELLFVVKVGVVFVLLLGSEIFLVETYVLGETFFVGLLALLDL